MKQLRVELEGFSDPLMQLINGVRMIWSVLAYSELNIGCCPYAKFLYGCLLEVLWCYLFYIPGFIWILGGWFWEPPLTSSWDMRYFSIWWFSKPKSNLSFSSCYALISGFWVLGYSLEGMMVPVLWARLGRGSSASESSVLLECNDSSEVCWWFFWSFIDFHYLIAGEGLADHCRIMSLMESFWSLLEWCCNRGLGGRGGWGGAVFTLGLDKILIVWIHLLSAFKLKAYLYRSFVLLYSSL